MSLFTISLVPPHMYNCECMLTEFSIDFYTVHLVEVDYSWSSRSGGINRTIISTPRGSISSLSQVTAANFDLNFSVPSRTFENFRATLEESSIVARKQSKSTLSSSGSNTKCLNEFGNSSNRHC